MRDTNSTARKKRLSTKQKQHLFLEAFAEHGNVLLSAQKVGVHRTLVYKWLEHDEDFFFAFNQAKEYDEPVYHLGRYQGTVRKYSDTLLIFHAKALMSEYREKSQVDVTNHMQVQRDPALQSLTDEEVETLERISNRTATNRE